MIEVWLTSHGADPDMFVLVTQDELSRLRGIEGMYGRLTSPRAPLDDQQFVEEIKKRAHRDNRLLITWYI